MIATGWPLGLIWRDAKLHSARQKQALSRPPIRSKRSKARNFKGRKIQGT
jgi:hypothetical protein